MRSTLQRKYLALVLAAALCGNIAVQPIYAVSEVVASSFAAAAQETEPGPTAEPTAVPTAELTAMPTAAPTAEPTAEPTVTPTAEPTTVPTAEPTATPTAEPTATPAPEATATPAQDAATVVAQGTLNALTWTLDSAGALTVTGQGGLSSAPWAEWAAQIKTVSLPQGLTSIGSSVFQNCTALVQIRIPEGVTEIGVYAFDGCTALKTVALPETLKTLRACAFRNCSALTGLIIPAGVTKIYYRCLEGCTGLRSLTLPTLDFCSSSGSYNLYQLNDLFTDGEGNLVPESLKTVTVTAPENVIPTGAFQNCAYLEQVNLPSAVHTINSNAFDGCSSLKEAPLPAALTSIGSYAFQGCSAFTEIEIPESVTDIGVCAFRNCTGAAKVTLPQTMDYLRAGALMGCSALTELTIPDGVAKIYYNCLQGCTSLESLTLPTLDFCSSSGSFTMQTLNDLFTDGEENLVPESLKTVTITDKETYVPADAFRNCAYLEQVNLPAGVYAIGDYAFAGCTALRELELPAGLGSIGSYAFHGCVGFTEMAVPAGVTDIGACAFRDCTGLEKITLPETLNYLRTGALMGCSALTELTVPDSIAKLYVRVLEGCTALEKLTLPASVYYDADGYSHYGLNELFSDGTEHLVPQSLKTVVASPKMTVLWEKAFQNCAGLTSVILPDTMTVISDYAFDGCTGLKTLQLPAGLGSIGNYAFRNCIGLTEMEIPEGTTDIGGYAFMACVNLEKVYLPSTLLRVYTYAFGNCTGLTALDFPSGLAMMRKGALFGCTGLRRLTLPMLQFRNNGQFTSYSNTVNSLFTNDSDEVSAPAALTRLYLTQDIKSLPSGSLADLPGVRILSVPASVTYAYDDCLTGSTDGLSVQVQSGSYMEKWCQERGIPVMAQNGLDVLRVDEDKFGIQVRDSDNYPVYGAAVSYDEETYTTDINGLAQVPLDEAAYPIRHLLSVSAPGYLTYTDAGHSQDGHRYDVVFLIRDDEPLQLGRADLTITSDEPDTVVGSVLQDTYRINVAGEETYALRVALADSSVAVDSWELRDTADGAVLCRAGVGGIFYFSAQDIKGWNSNLYVAAIAPEDSEHLDRQLVCQQLALGRVNGEAVQAGYGSMTFGQDMTITLPEDFPGIGKGGQTITVKDMNIPLSIGVEEDRIMVVLNVVVTEGAWKNGSFSFTDIKKNLTDYRSMLNAGLSGAEANLNEKLSEAGAALGGKHSIIDNPQIKVMMVGTAEGSLLTGKVNGTIYAIFSCAYTKEWQAGAAIGQPIVVALDFEGRIQGSASGTLQFREMELVSHEFNLAVTPSIEIGLSLGVGIKNVASVGVYGKAYTSAQFGLAGTPKGLVYWLYGGNAGVSVRVLGGELASIALFSSGDKYIYPRSRNSALAAGTGTPSLADMLTDADRYTPIRRDYLGKTSLWQSGAAQSGGLTVYDAALAALETDNTLQALQTNVYGDLRPTLVSCGDTQMLLFAADAGESRADADRTAVMYSLYDPESESWAAPQMILDDGTADFAIDAYSDGDAVYVVWQDADTTYPADAGLAEKAAGVHLTLAVYRNGSWTTQTVTGTAADDTYENLPRVTAKDGTVWVSWLENAADPVFGVNGVNTACFAKLENSTWSAAVAAAVDAMVTSASLGLWNSTPALALVQDADRDIMTTEDMTAAIYSADGTLLGNTAAEEAQFAAVDGADALIYCMDGALYRWEDAAVEAVCITPETLVLPADAKLLWGSGGVDGAVWTVTADNRSTLYGVVRDSETGEWSEPAALLTTEENSYLENIALAGQNGENLLVCTRRTVDWDADSAISQNDLCWMPIVHTVDLTLEDVYWDSGAAQAGGTLPVELYITNRGTRPADTVTVTVSDADGAVLYQAEHAAAIAGGGSGVLALELPLWAEPQAKDLTVTVSAAEETAAADNSKNLAVGAADLAVDTALTICDGAYTVVVTVANEGMAPAAGTLTMTRGDTGAVFHTAAVDTLAAGETVTFMVPLSRTTLGAWREQLEVQAAVESEAQQSYTGNDTAWETLLGDPYLVLGDVYDRFDGKINVQDLLYLANCLAQKQNLSASGKYRADLNGDDVQDVCDLMLLAQQITGK